MYNLHHKMNCRVFYFDITEDQLDPGASLAVTIKESWPQVLWFGSNERFEDAITKLGFGM